MSLSRIFLATLAMSAGAGVTKGAAAQDIVTVAQGQLRGSTAGSVTSFKGIPFAAPPVGELRWRPPAPAKSWSGLRDATRHGPQCTQVSFLGKRVQQSEDCLTVSIWKPANARAGAKLPVMVWIYGGGFIVGGNAVGAYDGTHFAENGVILVALNYRVGKLGFFAHPALTAETPGAPTGNFAVMDAIAALQWVKGNVASFGGDPGNVTIYGQSAGGSMVNLLMTSPAAAGLFHKAISQSGAFRIPYRTLAGGAGSAEAVGEAFAKANGITATGPEALKALRALPADAIAGDAQIGDSGVGSAAPMIDGRIVVETPYDAFAANREAKVPYIAGGTSGESSLNPTATPESVYAQLGEHAKAIRAAYPGKDEKIVAREILTDSMMTAPARDLTRLHGSHGAKSYAYYFSYLPEAQRATLQLTPHGGDVLYMFNNLTSETFAFYDLSHPPAQPRDLEMQRTVMGFWTNFARTGAPGTSNGVSWPTFLPSGVIMEFGPDHAQARPLFRQAQLDAISAVPAISPVIKVETK